MNEWRKIFDFLDRFNETGRTLTRFEILNKRSNNISVYEMEDGIGVYYDSDTFRSDNLIAVYTPIYFGKNKGRYREWVRNR